MATIEPTENGSTKAPEPESNLIAEAVTAFHSRVAPGAATITPATEAQTGNENQNAGSGLAQLTSEHKAPLAATKNTVSMVDNKWPGWPGDCVFRLIVPVAKVGSIIGRKGELIKKMSEESRARIRVLDGAAGTSDRIVLISGKEQPEATLSPAMDAAVRVFKRVSGFSENEGESKSASVGVTFCSIRLLVASCQAINLIGKQGSLIKSIQENTGASVRVLSGDEVPFYAASDERIVELQGEASKVLKALEAVIGHLRKFLVDHSVLPLFEKTYNATVTQERQVDTRADKSVLQNAPQTAVSSIYSLSSKREPLFLDRESQLEQQFPSSGISLYGQDPSHSGIRSSGISRAGAPVVTQVSQTMQIPLSYAEDLIGVEGANIAYIRHTSGAILTVQESRGLPDEITVEIRGTSSQVQMAQQLILEVISNHKEPVASAYGRLDYGLRSSYPRLGSTNYPSSSLSSQSYGGGYGSSGLGGGCNAFRL